MCNGNKYGIEYKVNIFLMMIFNRAVKQAIGYTKGQKKHVLYLSLTLYIVLPTITNFFSKCNLYIWKDYTLKQSIYYILNQISNRSAHCEPYIL